MQRVKPASVLEPRSCCKCGLLTDSHFGGTIDGAEFRTLSNVVVMRTSILAEAHQKNHAKEINQGHLHERGTGASMSMRNTKLHHDCRACETLENLS